jgi:hypothetical protein
MITSAGKSNDFKRQCENQTDTGRTCLDDWCEKEAADDQQLFVFVAATQPSQLIADMEPRAPRLK